MGWWPASQPSWAWRWGCKRSTPWHSNKTLPILGEQPLESSTLSWRSLLCLPTAFSAPCGTPLMPQQHLAQVLLWLWPLWQHCPGYCLQKRRKRLSSMCKQHDDLVLLCMHWTALVSFPFVLTCCRPRVCAYVWKILTVVLSPNCCANFALLVSLVWALTLTSFSGLVKNGT